MSQIEKKTKKGITVSKINNLDSTALDLKVQLIEYKEKLWLEKQYNKELSKRVGFLKKNNRGEKQVEKQTRGCQNSGDKWKQVYERQKDQNLLFQSEIRKQTFSLLQTSSEIKSINNDFQDNMGRSCKQNYIGRDKYSNDSQINLSGHSKRNAKIQYEDVKPYNLNFENQLNILNKQLVDSRKQCARLNDQNIRLEDISQSAHMKEMKIKQLLREIERLNNNLSGIKQQNRQIDERNMMQAKEQYARQVNERLQTENRQLQRQNSQLRIIAKLLDSQKQKCAFIENQKHNLIIQLNSLKNQSFHQNEMKQKINQLLNEKIIIENKKSQLQSNYHEIQYQFKYVKDINNKQCQTLKTKNSQLVAQINDQQKQLAKLSAQLSSKSQNSQEKHKMVQQIQRSQSQNSKLQQKINNLQQQLINQRNSYAQEKIKQDNELQNQLNEKDKILNQLKDKLEQAYLRESSRQLQKSLNCQDIENQRIQLIKAKQDILFFRKKIEQLTKKNTDQSEEYLLRIQSLTKDGNQSNSTHNSFDELNAQNVIEAIKSYQFRIDDLGQQLKSKEEIEINLRSQMNQLQMQINELKGDLNVRMLRQKQLEDKVYHQISSMKSITKQQTENVLNKIGSLEANIIRKNRQIKQKDNFIKQFLLSRIKTMTHQSVENILESINQYFMEKNQSMNST